jgi:hypothetical protein
MGYWLPVVEVAYDCVKFAASPIASTSISTTLVMTQQEGKRRNLVELR